MSEEKKLKLVGEDLAKKAVDSGMGASQLKTVYKLVKTRPLPFVQAHLQRQISRALERSVSGLAGFQRILDVLGDYEDRKASFERILMYAVMLYPYYEKEPVLELTVSAQPVVKRIVDKTGAEFEGISMRRQGNYLQINVRVRGFSGYAKSLAKEIEDGLKKKPGFSGLNLRVWIER